MQLIRPDIKIDFMGRRHVFGLASAILVAASIVLVIFPGPKYGIDFSGGTQAQILFRPGTKGVEVRQALAKSGYRNAEVVAFGDRDGEYLITVQQTSPVSAETATKARDAVRAAFPEQELSVDSWRVSSSGDRLEATFRSEIDTARFEEVLSKAGLQVRPHRPGEVSETHEGEDAAVCSAPVCRMLPMSEYRYEVDLVGVAEQVVAGLREQLGDEAFVNAEDPTERVLYVGPKVGNQLKRAAITSLVYALVFIMLYIAVRFDLRFAPGAVIALIHDVAITLGIFVIIRHEISLPIVAALLTIVGYSLNDTIVVFDRIRENFQKLRERELAVVVNQSINETLSRTLLTSATTLFTVLAIYVLGGGLIKDFALALIIGIVVGTYSSIFVASPIVVFLDRRFFRKQAQA